MNSQHDNRLIFFEILATSLVDNSFHRVTLSKPLPSTPWKRVVASVYRNSQHEIQIALEYDDGRQVRRENLAPDDAREAIQRLLDESFTTANLRWADENAQFERTSRGSYRLKRQIVDHAPPPVIQHNREKNYLIPPSAPFLVGLGIASAGRGEIKRERYDKFRQINKFVEIISHLLPESLTTSSRGVRAIDFGSGKHYLTFALGEYLRHLSPASSVIGIEQREELVTLGRDVASSLRWSHLTFQAGTIADSDINSVDLVIALHACDTATDDAIAKAIMAETPYICVAPCCHKYVRKHFAPSADLKPILRHGILEERFAESLTDSLRVLALEASGYQTKLFEFVSLEHTAKNVMITATKTGRRNQASREALCALKEKFSLRDFYLDRCLWG